MIAEFEVMLRIPDQVAKCGLALLLIGIHAECFREYDPINLKQFNSRCPIGLAALSNNKRNFILLIVHSQQSKM
jgi:hypothetical protein